MHTQCTPLQLQDLQVGKHIDVIDRLRKYGIHARVDEIVTKDGVMMVKFTNLRTAAQYVWRASAMGLTTGTYAFWTTYRQNRGPDNITFGSLYHPTYDRTG